MKTLGSFTQAEWSLWNLQIQWSLASINHPSFITPPPGTNPFPLPYEPSSCGTSSSGVLHEGPDDAEDHRSATCGSAGRRYKRSAGRSYRRTRSLRETEVWGYRQSRTMQLWSQKAVILCRCQFPSVIQTRKAKSHQHDLKTLLMNGKLLVIGIVLFFLLFFVYESWIMRGLSH